jgi:type II secretory pathway pseudopilin PulG
MRHPSSTGISLVEAVLVVAAIMFMIGVLAPSLTAVRDNARLTRAATDMLNIKTALTTALNNMGFVRFTTNGRGNGTTVQLLVSDGDTPRDCDAGGACGGGANTWDRAVDNTTGLVDFLERHLVTNNPRGDSANDYPAGAGSWRGPYLNAPIDPDPWGNRYMVNSQFYNINPTNVDVLSSGPDSAIATPWSGNPLTPGGDDIVLIVQP